MSACTKSSVFLVFLTCALVTVQRTQSQWDYWYYWCPYPQSYYPYYYAYDPYYGYYYNYDKRESGFQEAFEGTETRDGDLEASSNEVDSAVAD
ncbi:hypothetical protein AAVH_23963 [Aphelenchoides avenae]|nr:hypothetical protein AAVH_23963 [Aphelenchus avenae]